MGKLLSAFTNLLVVLLALTLTNRLLMHKLDLREKIAARFDERLITVADSTSSTKLANWLSGPVGAKLREALLENLLQRGVSRTNYVLFALTALAYHGMAR